MSDRSTVEPSLKSVAPRPFVSELLQISVISMIILSVTLIVATLLMYNQWRADYQRAQTAEARLEAIELELERVEAELKLQAATATLGGGQGLPPELTSLLKDPQTMAAIGQILLKQPELTDVMTGDNAGELLQLGLQVLDAYNTTKPKSKP